MEFLTIKQVCEQFNFSRWTLDRKVRDGRLRKVRDGGVVRFPKDSVDAYAASLANSEYDKASAA